MQIDLTGKTAFITGASYGIGKGIALRFARSGANVVILARRPDQLAQAVEDIRAAGNGRVEGIACDVTDAAGVEAAVGRAKDAFGHIDILVNNAGSSLRRPFEKLTAEDMLGDLDLKVVAAVRLSQLVMPGMKERMTGRIINIVSINAKTPVGESAPTTLSRAAGITMTKVMSHELAPWNILVNALCVGKIKSGQNERRHKTDAPHLSYDDYLAELSEPIPLRRFGEAEEFANVACFLASDAASYVTGTAINVDGGLCPVT